MTNYISMNLNILETLGKVKGKNSLKKLSLLIFREVVCSKVLTTKYKFTVDLLEQYRIEERCRFSRIVDIEGINKITSEVFGIETSLDDRKKGEMTLMLTVVNKFKFEEAKKTKHTGYFKLKLDDFKILPLNNTFYRYCFLKIHRDGYDFKKQFIKYGKSSNTNYSRDLRETIEYIEKYLNYKVIDNKIIDETESGINLSNLERRKVTKEETSNAFDVDSMEYAEQKWAEYEEIEEKIKEVLLQVPSVSPINNTTVLKILNKNKDVNKTAQQIRSFLIKYGFNNTGLSNHIRKLKELGGHEIIYEYFDIKEE